jgi:hypothetical protein
MTSGSILVYGAVATCGAAGGGGTAARDAGRVDVSAANDPDVSASSVADVSAPGGPDVSTPGGLDLSRVLDVLTDPVPTARADSPQSGSRLKAVYYVGADGSKQPIPGQVGPGDGRQVAIRDHRVLLQFLCVRGC